MTGTFEVPSQYKDLQRDPPGATYPCEFPATRATTSAASAAFALAVDDRPRIPISTASGFGTDPSVFYRFDVDARPALIGKFVGGAMPSDAVLAPGAVFTQTSTSRQPIAAW